VVAIAAHASEQVKAANWIALLTGCRRAEQLLVFIIMIAARSSAVSCS
jgi:hypothetical protein